MGRLQLQQIGKSYGGSEVLSGIDLDVADGEFVVLVGPSGCGKSTLLRMVAGLEDITNGRLLIDGTVANRIPAKRRGLAMVFQSYALYPHMNVADNMSFALRISGVPKAERRAKVEAAADILGLTPFLDRLPAQLSGGQRQRVAMGRAIVREPSAFLFDEPLSNLDAKLRVRMRSEIKKLHQRLGKTTLYVTHDQTEAMTMGDRIVVLNDGGIAQAGPPHVLYADPESRFVASFIGSPEINLVPATGLGPGHPTVRTQAGLDLPLPQGLEIAEGRAVDYGIRPQTIELSHAGVPAEITLVEPTGESVDCQATIADAEITTVLPASARLKVGDRVHLAFDRDRALVFDRRSGDRLR